ncbi:MAG: bifunctional 5,10-methylenetetrahydrofolate dehydrogenase/5,10-methenyltetrahydrofolate cyclohydrolase [Phycisphaerae bacterium]
MPATIIDGVTLSIETRSRVKAGVRRLKALGHPVQLAAILVGASPAGEVYARRQGEACRALGIEYQLITLPADVSFQAACGQIDALNADAAVTGVMLHLPLPQHLNAVDLQYRITPAKDVEGVNPANIGYTVYGRTLIGPCTAMAAVAMVEASGVPLEGAEAVVVGASEIAGKPIALLLSQRKATVTICQKETADVPLHTRRADILVVAVGRPGLITADHIKPGACVIDVGINRVPGPDGKTVTVGDIDFDAVAEKAGHITPVPGGVGPMTVAMLMSNTLRAAELAASSA